MIKMQYRKLNKSRSWERSDCRFTGHHADYPGSLSVHYPGDFQANARKTGDYESDRD